MKVTIRIEKDCSLLYAGNTELIRQSGRLPALLWLNRIVSRRRPEKVVLRDVTLFTPEKGATGGCYWYATSYARVPGGYRREYYTSADFDYCSARGEFTSCEGCFDFRSGECAAPELNQKFTWSHVWDQVKKVISASWQAEITFVDDYGLSVIVEYVE